MSTDWDRQTCTKRDGFRSNKGELKLLSLPSNWTWNWWKLRAWRWKMLSIVWSHWHWMKYGHLLCELNLVRYSKMKSSTTRLKLALFLTRQLFHIHLNLPTHDQRPNIFYDFAYLWFGKNEYVKIDVILFLWFGNDSDKKFRINIQKFKRKSKM